MNATDEQSRMTDIDDNLLHLRRALVIATDGIAGAAVATGLADAGASVALLSDCIDPLAQPGGIATRQIALTSRDAVAAAIDGAVDELGAVDLAVLCLMPAAATALCSVAETSDEQWLAAPRMATRALLYCLQGTGRHVKASRGAVVMIGPSLALAGCRELVALSTALEAQRGMMKSVARQWGGSGATVNWIACAPHAWSPLFDRAPLAAKSDAVPVALGRIPSLQTDLIPVLNFFASPGGRSLTGTTVTLDGGEWMLP